MCSCRVNVLHPAVQENTTGSFWNILRFSSGWCGPSSHNKQPQHGLPFYCYSLGSSILSSLSSPKWFFWYLTGAPISKAWELQLSLVRIQCYHASLPSLVDLIKIYTPGWSLLPNIHCLMVASRYHLPFCQHLPSVDKIWKYIVAGLIFQKPQTEIILGFFCLLVILNTLVKLSVFKRASVALSGKTKAALVALNATASTDTTSSWPKGLSFARMVPFVPS